MMVDYMGDVFVMFDMFYIGELFVLLIYMLIV